MDPFDRDALQDIIDYTLPSLEKRIDAAPSIFKIWFGGLKLADFTEDNVIVLITPTNLRKKILLSKYREVMNECFSATLGFAVTVDVISQEDIDFPSDDEKEENEKPEETEIRKKDELEREKKINEILTSEPGKKSLLDEYTFENFIEGASNKFAKAACLAVAKEPTTYNPLFIYGHSGLGKTHLLYAVINYIKKEHPSLNIVYKKSEDFINELIAAIQDGSTATFKERYRSADVLLLDDIQFIAGKESMQEEFFHTFSSLYEADKQIILTSDRPPKEMKNLEDRLRTRFEGGLLADVQPPSFELRVAIIQKKMENMPFSLSEELIHYIAERLQNNVRQIEGILKKLQAISTIEGTVIDQKTIDQVIKTIDPGNFPTNVLIQRILFFVAQEFFVSIEDMKSKKKTDRIAGARHVAIYLIRKMTDLPLKEIGNIFNRDHTTVMASINKCEINIQTRKNAQGLINKLMKDIKGQ